MTKGRYGIHGGQYIPETLMNAVIELEDSYFLVYRGSPARGDSDSDASKYLWSGAFIYCTDDGTG